VSLSEHLIARISFLKGKIGGFCKSLQLWQRFKLPSIRPSLKHSLQCYLSIGDCFGVSSKVNFLEAFSWLFSPFPRDWMYCYSSGFVYFFSILTNESSNRKLFWFGIDPVVGVEPPISCPMIEGTIFAS